MSLQFTQMWDSSCCSFSNAWLANILEWICWKYSGTYGHSPFSPSWQTSMSKHMHARYPTHPTHITPANKHLFNPASLIGLFSKLRIWGIHSKRMCISFLSLFWIPSSHFSSLSWAPNFTNTSLGLVVYYFLGGWDSKWYFPKKRTIVNQEPENNTTYQLNPYDIPSPIGSMYGIFTYIWLDFLVNVGEYNSSNAQGGGGSFQNRKPIGKDWLLWITDDKAKTLSHWSTD